MSESIGDRFWNTFYNDHEFRVCVDKINNEKNHVDVKPYSHNIISMYLESISKKYNQEFSNYIIKNFGLVDLGWVVVE